MSNEQSYSAGERAAWRAMLQTCLRELGHDSPESSEHGWIIEREAAVAALRSACAEYGDNEWPVTLNLADVIEKHLIRHIDK